MPHLQNPRGTKSFPSVDYRKNETRSDGRSDRERELNKIISSFKKGKSLGSDGFTLEFFLGFYDMLKDDIMKVVRES